MKKKQGFVTKTEFAKKFGMNLQTLAKLIERDGFPVADDGTIHYKTGKDWLAKNREATSKLKRLQAAKIEAELRKLKINQEMAEIELKLKRGELVEKKEEAASLGRVLTTINQELQVLPTRLQHAFPETTGIQRVGTELVNDLIQRLRDYAGEKEADCHGDTSPTPP
jgi:phage terminase Nu1 subunit (DNA packaging protein)